MRGCCISIGFSDTLFYCYIVRLFAVCWSSVVFSFYPFIARADFNFAGGVFPLRGNKGACGGRFRIRLRLKMWGSCISIGYSDTLFYCFIVLLLAVCWSSVVFFFFGVYSKDRFNFAGGVFPFWGIKGVSGGRMIRLRHWNFCMYIGFST